MSARSCARRSRTRRPPARHGRRTHGVVRFSDRCARGRCRGVRLRRSCSRPRGPGGAKLLHLDRSRRWSAAPRFRSCAGVDDALAGTGAPSTGDPSWPVRTRGSNRRAPRSCIECRRRGPRRSLICVSDRLPGGSRCAGGVGAPGEARRQSHRRRSMRRAGRVLVLHEQLERRVIPHVAQEP